MYSSLLDFFHTNLPNLVFFHPSLISSLSQLAIEVHEFQQPSQSSQHSHDEEKELLPLLTLVYKRMRNLRKRLEKYYSLDKDVSLSFDDFLTIESKQVLMVNIVSLC